MNSVVLSNPVTALRQAVLRAYPEHTALAGMEFEGSLVQAWETFSRVLAITPDALARAVAKVWGIPAAASLESANSETLQQVPSTVCQKYGVLPLRLEDDHLVLATANPFNENVTEMMRFAARRPVRWELAPPQRIEDASVAIYAKEALRQANSGKGVGGIVSGGKGENTIVRLARTLLTSAFEQRASDFHIQPFFDTFAVRVRVDGQLRRLTVLPDAVATSLIRHMKARSGMDPSNMLIPQDGRMSMIALDREIDMRVSTLPASRGERLVIRFLDQSRVHRLSDASFSHADLQTLRRATARPSGMVVMTGPTGSGKTSTLYGALAEINRSSVNIITVENPVEYRIPGISQVEVNEKAGRTFAAALRSILRQDPDVVLIGEIRDDETAEIASQAALTGHLVLTTLHTNDAITAIPRLLNLGVQPSVLADSLSVIIAQRLCRQLCKACRVPVAEPLLPEERMFKEVTHNTPAYRAVGCKACDYTGFKGRLPIVDIIEMNQGLRDAVAVGETRIGELEKHRSGGLKSLAASGSLRIISGDTTVSEVMSAVGPGFWPELADHYDAVCFADALDLAPHHVSSGQSVLVINPQDGLIEPLEAALAEEGLHLVVAKDSKAAEDQLRRDDNIAFIIGDLAENADQASAAALLQDNRLHIAWARLPALVLLPSSLAGCEDALRDSGVMAAFMTKPLSYAEVVNHILHAQPR